jgi:hypothetical protein
MHARMHCREFAMAELQDQAIALHHEQRARHTVPSYGQALALANLMEQMHMEVRAYSGLLWPSTPGLLRPTANHQQLSGRSCSVHTLARPLFGVTRAE